MAKNHQLNKRGKMNSETYQYEYRILQHSIERGCPEDRIERELIQHPEYSRFLMEEARHHSPDYSTEHKTR